MPRKPGQGSHNRATRPPLTGRSVRCLGPGAEHRFHSPDPVRVRYCARCRKAVEAMNLSLRDEFTPGVAFDNGR